ncbi:MAG: hypothetical protein WEB13_09625, partial [Dehalococcoidia bacterium]
HRVVAVAVEFADGPPGMPATDATQLVRDGLAIVGGLSGGRVAFDVAGGARVYRLPRAVSAYGFASTTADPDLDLLLADTIALTDADIDYSATDFVYIVRPDGVPYEPSSAGFDREGIVADGNTIGFRAQLNAGHSATTVAHETMHLLGLPDLYDLALLTSDDDAARGRFVGTWDLMSLSVEGPRFLGWHRWKLGWLDDSDVRCVVDAAEEVVLSPVAGGTGTRLAVVRTGTERALAIELRTRVGGDSGSCVEGVLVYAIDTSIQTGAGLIAVYPSRLSNDQAQLATCGPLYNAPFAPGRTFADPVSGATLEVLGVEAAGYRVRITPPGATVGAGDFDRAITSAGVNAAIFNGGTVDQLASAALSVGAVSVTVFVDGSARVLVPGAPAFVNAAFVAVHPFGVPAGTIVIVVL